MQVKNDENLGIFVGLWGSAPLLLTDRATELDIYSFTYAPKWCVQ